MKKKIKFIVEDWKAPDKAIESLIKMANRKKYSFKPINDGSDDLIIAYCGEKFSTNDALDIIFPPHY